jgi:hypothetical protein
MNYWMCSSSKRLTNDDRDERSCCRSRKPKPTSDNLCHTLVPADYVFQPGTTLTTRYVRWWRQTQPHLPPGPSPGIKTHSSPRPFSNNSLLPFPPSALPSCTAPGSCRRPGRRHNPTTLTATIVWNSSRRNVGGTRPSINRKQNSMGSTLIHEWDCRILGS